MRTRTWILIVSIGFNLFLASCNLVSNAPEEDNSTSSPTINDGISSLQERSSYYEINLNKLASNVPTKGNSPEEIALNAFGNREVERSLEEEVTVDTSNPEQPTVIITQKNLFDDSVNSIRYRIDFEPLKSEDYQWQMVWAGQQFICQLGRGEQDWSKAFCS